MWPSQGRTLLFQRDGLVIIYVIAFVLATQLPSSQSQFISHINHKGLRGNVTFNVKEEVNETLLVIEALLEESGQPRWIQGHQDEDDFDSTQPILFEWSLYSNTLEPQMATSCSNEDLGPLVPNELQRSLTGGRFIAMDKLNRWSSSLNRLLEANSAKSLSSLIWGKSLKIRLSNIYGQSSKPPPVSTQNTQDQQSPMKPQPPKDIKPAQRASSAISRPQLAFSSTPSSTAHGTQSKPTFAPRPRPTISRPKANSSTSRPPNSRAKRALEDAAEAFVSSPNSTIPTAMTSTSSAPTAKSREFILEATRKRIARLYGNLVICANIIDTRHIKTAEAVFESHIGGKVTIRGNEDDTTLLMLNLYHIRSKVTTRHDWAIMASDILDNRREDEKCKYLQVVFDPNNVSEDSKCRRNETTKCRIGDLTKKHGQVQVAGQGRRTSATLVDLNLPLSTLEGSRSLFLVVYEVASKLSNNGLPSRSNILSCAPIKSVVGSRRVEAKFNMDGVRGFIRATQRHPTEPAQINYDLFGLEGNIKHQTIRELPLATRASTDNAKLCANLGSVYNPTKVAMTTGDSFPVGNLSAKHGPLSVIDSEYEDHYMGEFLDLNVQLFGPHSIVGRSILIHKNNGDPFVCSTLQYAADGSQPPSISLAVATFYYPVVGQISFQQPAGDPHAETSVLVELYNPNGGSRRPQAGNDEDQAKQDKPLGQNIHNWLIHQRPAGADFYNWSSRCESAGEVYDPILASVGLSQEVYARQCTASLMSETMRCKLGDTNLKSGFKLTLPNDPQDRQRYFYTDLYLPLSGQNSILGRSVVIYDDNAPLQRGNRLACSNIKIVHALRASVRSWDSGPSIPSAVRGSANFEQESPNKPTRIKLDLNGFNGNVEHYAIHDVWTTDDREFPCSNDSLYDIYDPHDNENSLKLPPSAHYGLSATVDRVKVGDLSRKHGTLEGLQSVQKSHVDSNLPLFAPHSIVGRSMVLRAAVNDFRWVCGNVELDYDKSSSREIIGIASFDDPRAKISGYVRFTQLEHKDGSLSDTFVQVDLRNQALVTDSAGGGAGSPAASSSSSIELKTSSNHNWAVFVNQVGEDAYIAADEVRCIAAGFKWNPYLAQDTLETYPTVACTASEQLGCAMGDLGLRHGHLTLGPNHRRSLSDSNLPLAGNYSVMGRSLVIFDNKRPHIKLACANIFPDIHLKSNVVIKRTPSFTVARFVEQMRGLLGASDWLLVPELRATKPVANGECVQMTIHFYGQRAHQMQVELNNLITLGTVRKSTRSGVEKISTHYKLCRAGQAQLTSGAGAPSLWVKLSPSGILMAAVKLLLVLRYLSGDSILRPWCL